MIAKTLVIEADNLERIKRVLDTLYEAGEDCVHPGTGEIVSDAEYDKIVKRLADLRPDSKELQGPTSSQLIITKKVHHNPPMTSINKAIGALAERQEILKNWFGKCDGALRYQSNPANHYLQTHQ